MQHQRCSGREGCVERSSGRAVVRPSSLKFSTSMPRKAVAAVAAPAEETAGVGACSPKPRYARRNESRRLATPTTLLYNLLPRSRRRTQTMLPAGASRLKRCAVYEHLYCLSQTTPDDASRLLHAPQRPSQSLAVSHTQYEPRRRASPLPNCSDLS